MWKSADRSGTFLPKTMNCVDHGDSVWNSPTQTLHVEALFTAVQRTLADTAGHALKRAIAITGALVRTAQLAKLAR
jgi:hypothetical protein